MASTCDTGVSALYLHVPFCVARCRYCDFSTSAVPHEDPLIGAYVGALRSLVRRAGKSGLLASIKTAYVGGGTPTMAGADLAELVREASAACRQAGSPLGEFSSEANPESLDVDLVRSLAESGLTRISLGVQSLNDAELARLGRVHDRTRALQATSAVRDAGLDLSCDLMCATPLQTAESLEASLHGVLDAGASHVSCYPLMVEEGTPLWRACESGEEVWPEDDAEADLMLVAERVLSRAGLTRYEVASYARPGHVCQHNIAYWTGRSYLGLGTSAASMLTPQEFAALAEALPLLCAPEDPAAADPELWGDAESTVAARDVRASSGASDKPCDLGDRLFAIPGVILAKRALAASEDHIARVRIRLTDNARRLTDAVRENAPLHIAVETLSKREALAEDLMLGMRMSAGVGTDLLARARGVMGTALDAALADVEARDLAIRTPEGRLAPTEQGWLLGNELYEAFWDLA
ncbi:MAG: coproporphyrinogen III oxidase family protein [Coriobacteriia bacterium]|nr:coproporphyrinogen III oxidase family protein [Coriobacteriia bacterium]